MRTILVALSIPVAVIACGSGAARSAEGDSTSGQVAQAEALPTGPDPCTLVSQAEMETLIGPLAEPPFRVNSNRRPDPRGELCLYRARDRRSVTLDVDWDDGELAFRMFGSTAIAASEKIAGYDPAADTLEGKWDKVGASFGHLIALKGKTSVLVDPVGSRLGLDGAARVAAIAVNRVGSPLAYSGAKATLARKEAPPTLRNPCDLVTRKEAEALIGPLKQDPKPNADKSECEYITVVEMMGYPVTHTLKVVWTDGFYALGQERQAISGAQKAMVNRMDPDIPKLSQDAVKETEPWDDRVTLMGMQITVVKNDVMLQTTANGAAGFDEAKALEMLRIAARRL